MKLMNRIFVLSVISVIGLCSVAGAVERLVLWEHFTNWSCGPCATYNPIVRTALEQMTEDTVVSCKYHVNWPGANDGFYLYNVSEQTSRWNYYNVTGVPDAFIDGGDATFTSVNAVKAGVRSHFAISSPCTIELSAFVAGETSIGFSGSVIAETGMNNSSTRLFVILKTDAVTYSTPPGSNGETYFPDVFRDFWPSSSGQSFTLEAGEHLDFQGTLNCMASWDPADLRVIAFVQTTSNRAILQSEQVEVNQFYGAVMGTTSPHQSLGESNVEQTYQLDLTSVGTNEDTYTVTLSGDLPEGWTRTVEATDVPAENDLIDFVLAGGGTTTLTIRVNPNGHPGTCETGINVISENMESLDLNDSFTHMSGLDILIIDADNGESYENYYTDAINFALEEQSRTLVTGVWDTHRDALDANLDGIGLVMWSTGAGGDDQTLSDTDILTLTDYLDNGGAFFLFSQGAGHDLYQSQFYNRYLHALYTGNRPSLTQVEGIASDDLTDGMTFQLGSSSGDGIDQTRQHSMNAADENATRCFKFTGSSNYCAVRFENETYKMLYCGFGFEGIAGQDNRTELMSRALDWVYPMAANEPNEPQIPAVYSLDQNFPNPFNPTTVIPFALPERAEIRLAVYDLLGRNVATLVNGVMEAGQHSVEFDGTSLSSGVYFYKLESANFQSARKLVLMK